MSARYARLVIRLRWVIVVAGVAGTVAAVLLLPDLHSVGTADFSAVVPEDLPAIATQRQVVQDFAFPALARVAVVQHDARGLSPATQVQIVRSAVDRTTSPRDGVAGALPIENSFGLVPSSSQDGTTAITYLFFRSGGTDARLDAAHRYAHDELGGPSADVVGVTGAVPARVAQGREITGALPFVELGGVFLVVVAVGLVFRSVVAPIVALVSVATAYLLAVHLLPLFARHVGLGAPGELEPLIVVLVVGVMTDYAIFYLHALRRGVRSGMSSREACERAIAETTPLVLTAVVTVAASTGSLVVARLPLFHNVGPGMAAATLVAAGVAVVFLPASIAVLGGHALSGRERSAAAAGGRAGGAPAARPSWRVRLARLGTRRPVAVLVATAGVGGLLALAWPIGGAHLGVNLVEGLPRGTEASRAARAAGEGFAPGIVAPTEIVVRATRITDRRSDLVALQDRLRSQHGVAGILGPAQDLAPSPLGVLLATSGDSARFLVVLDHAPYSAPAIEDLQRLRARMPDLLRSVGLHDATFGIAGDTALSAEIVDMASHDLVRIAVTILLVELVILAVFLRALVAPALVLGVSLLVVLAALSVTNELFGATVGSTSLTFYVPFAAAVLLVAFGSDYNVYVVGRIWEEARTRPLRDAIAVAGSSAASAVSAAGVTLAATFALLGIIGLTGFRQFAFAMAFGALVDTFVVRSVIVPSLLSTFGRWSAWPRRFDVATMARRGGHGDTVTGTAPPTPAAVGRERA